MYHSVGLAGQILFQRKLGASLRNSNSVKIPVQIKRLCSV